MNPCRNQCLEFKILGYKSTQVTLFSSLASLFNVFDPTSGTQIGSVAGFVCITSAELDLQVSQEKNFATSLLQSFHPQCSVDGVCSVVMVAAQQFLFSVNRLFKDIHIRENIETYTVFKERERERDAAWTSPLSLPQPLIRINLMCCELCSLRGSVLVISMPRLKEKAVGFVTAADSSSTRERRLSEGIYTVGGKSAKFAHQRRV